MSEDLVSFLTARLDETQRLAQAYLEHAVARKRPGPERWANRTLLDAVKGMRAVAARHRLAIVKADVYPFDRWTGEPNLAEYEVTCEVCGWAGNDPASARMELRILAAAYSTHPGYRAGWMPE